LSITCPLQHVKWHRILIEKGSTDIRIAIFDDFLSESAVKISTKSLDLWS